MRVINRRRVTFRDNERRTLNDRFVGGGGFFRPKTNKVIVQARNIHTGEIEETRNDANLIVYHGRSWLMQRAFGFPLGAVGDSSNPYPWEHSSDTDVTDIYHGEFHNMYINWFAVGSGGADVENSPLEPYDTTSVEYELLNHVSIGGEADVDPSGVTANLRYAHPAPFGGAGVTRDYHQFDPQYPQYMFDPDVVPGQGGTEDPNYWQLETSNSTTDILYGGFKTDSYLRALIRVTLAPEECNGPKYYDPLDPGEEYSYLNEAGLYVSRSYDPANFAAWTTNNEVQMFAKVNFSSIRKDDTRELIFSWYVYF